MLQFQPLFHALLCHHSPNPSILPHIFQKIHQLDLPPIVVIEDDKVLEKDSGDGGLNAEGVAAERVEVETLEGLAGGVFDASDGVADKGDELGDGLVAKAVEPREDDEAEVERLSGGVETAVNFES